MTNSLLQKLDTFSKVALLRPEKTLTGNSMYEVVLNSGCLTASPQELQRQKAIAIFKALKHKEIPGVNFITSATERLPEGGISALQQEGIYHFGEKFKIFHPNLQITKNVFGGRVLQSSMSETFEDELHENPEHITLASITHSDPENIGDMVQRSLEKNPTNLAARTARTIAINNKITPTMLASEYNGYCATVDSLELLEHHLQEAQGRMMVVKRIGHGAGGANVFFLCANDLKKESKIKKIRELFTHNESFLLFHYLPGSELRKENTLFLSVHMRPFLIGETQENYGGVLKFCEKGVEEHFLESDTCRQMDIGNRQKILNGSGGNSTSIFFNSAGQAIQASRSSGVLQQQEAQDFISHFTLPNQKPANDAHSIKEIIDSSKEVVTIMQKKLFNILCE